MNGDELRKLHTLTCRPGHYVKIELGSGIDPATPIGRLFAEEGIDIILGHVSGGQVRLVIVADAGLEVRHNDFHY
jgi:hypothetical protein